MTRRLILIRHAKSSWDSPATTDHDRPLNERGRRAATAIGNWLRRRDYLPDAILSSSATRTVETAERLALDVPARFTRRLYHASAGTMLEALREAPEANILMLGHNPGIGDFAERLLRAPPDHPRFFDYPTCATLIADFPVETWAEADFATAYPVDFIVPRDLA